MLVLQLKAALLIGFHPHYAAILREGEPYYVCRC